MPSRTIYGILAPPRVSRNNNLYLPEELARADGLTVPLYLDHEDFETSGGRPTGRILRKEARGRLKLIWNSVQQRLEYLGEVWDSALQKLIATGQRPHVSLAAEPRKFENYRGHNVPLDLQFFSVAAVENPGMPESTITMEQYLSAYIESAAPVVLESKNGMAQMMVLEFDTLSLESAEAFRLEDERQVAEQTMMAAKILKKLTGEHDFDAAIDALKKIDSVVDKAKAEEQNPTGPQMQSVSEPLHPDFQKMKSAMKDKYGDKGDSIFYATVNKRGLDDSKPMPKEAMEEMGAMLNNPSLIPQGYQNLTPMRANVNQRSGLTGVTGVSQGVPMQGDGTNAVKSTGIMDPKVRPVITPTAQDQQILPRNMPAAPQVPVPVPTNLQPRTSVDNRNATGTGVSRESANKSSAANQSPIMSTVSEDDGRGNASSALQKKWGAPTDGEVDAGLSSAATPHDVSQKHIGMASTPYEQLLADKVVSGNATKEELALYNHLMKEGKIEPVGTGHSNPNTQATAGVDNSGNGTVNSNRSTREEEEEAEDGDKKKAEEDLKEAKVYGFSNEDFYGMKSTYTKEQWPEAWRTMKEALKSNPKVREFIRRNRLEISGVINPPPSRRESREGGEGVTARTMSTKFGIEMSLPTLEQHVSYMRGERGPVAPMHVPYFFPPRITRAGGMAARLEFIDELADWTATKQQIISEAIATTTSGAAMAVDGAVPALIVPTQLSAMLRDTVYFQQIQQGSNIARFQTITVPTAGALTQNTEPSQASQTLATVDITPTPRGVEQQISFEAERKILGPILEGVILSFRVSELYDEDYLLLGSGQAFPSAAIPTSGGLYSTGNQLFGNGRASEATIIAADTFTLANLTDAQETITAEGYAPNNLAVVMQPQQFRKLMQDSNVNRLISFGPNTTPGQSWVAQGVIPELVGFEVRRSTLGTTGTGSAAITTYNAWAFVKGLTPGMAASRDLMIETFRDIRVNSTWVKGHWDLKAAVLHPNSLVQIDTA